MCTGQIMIIVELANVLCLENAVWRVVKHSRTNLLCASISKTKLSIHWPKILCVSWGWVGNKNVYLFLAQKLCVCNQKCFTFAYQCMRGNQVNLYSMLLSMFHLVYVFCNMFIAALRVAMVCIYLTLTIWCAYYAKCKS